MPCETERVAPSPGPALEPAYVELCDPESRPEVTAAFSRGRAHEELPCAFLSSKGSRKLPGMSAWDSTLLASFPQTERPGTHVAGATEAGVR